MKLQHSSTLFVLIFAFCLVPTVAQEGNGVGTAYVNHNPAMLGGTLTLEFGAPGVPFAAGLMSRSRLTTEATRRSGWKSSSTASAK